jgi:hypothetical protein
MLPKCLGKASLTDLHGVSEPPPKPLLQERGEKTGLANEHSDVSASPAGNQYDNNFGVGEAR